MFKKFFRDNKVHKKVVPFLDVIFLFKPVNMFIVWVFICVGMYLSSFYPSLFLQEINMSIIDFHISTFLLFMGATILFGCINISDESDGSFDISDKIKILLFIISFILLTGSNWRFFIVASIIYILSGPFYKLDLLSISTKRLISNIIKCFLLILLGIIHSLASNAIQFIISVDFFLLVMPYLLSYFSINLLYELSYSNNKSNTSIVSAKYRKKVLFSTILIVFSLCLSLYLDDALLSSVLVVSIPFFLYALIRGMKKDIERVMKYPIAILNIFVMFIYPVLFLIIFVTFYISKYYYWHRLDVHYPTFLVDD